MSYISGDIIRDATGGTLSAGLVGHNAYSQFEGFGADIAPNTQAVPVQVNQQSMTAAENRAVKPLQDKINALDPKGSSRAMLDINAGNSTARGRYASLFTARGLPSATPSSRRAGNHRSALRHNPQPVSTPQSNNKTSWQLNRALTRVAQIKNTFASVPRQQTAPISPYVLEQKRRTLATAPKRPRAKLWAGFMVAPSYI